MEEFHKQLFTAFPDIEFETLDLVVGIPFCNLAMAALRSVRSFCICRLDPRGYAARFWSPALIVALGGTENQAASQYGFVW